MKTICASLTVAVFLSLIGATNARTPVIQKVTVTDTVESVSRSGMTVAIDGERIQAVGKTTSLDCARGPLADISNTRTGPSTWWS